MAACIPFPASSPAAISSPAPMMSAAQVIHSAFMRWAISVGARRGPAARQKPRIRLRGVAQSGARTGSSELPTYELQVYVIYDLGAIRDEAEFKRDLENVPGVSVLIVKH